MHGKKRREEWHPDNLLGRAEWATLVEAVEDRKLVTLKMVRG